MNTLSWMGLIVTLALGLAGVALLAVAGYERALTRALSLWKLTWLLLAVLFARRNIKDERKEVTAYLADRDGHCEWLTQKEHDAMLRTLCDARRPEPNV